MARKTGFIQDTQTNISQLLQSADNWSALQQENTAENYFGTLVQADLDGVFGVNAITLQQYQDALVAMQGVVDNIHLLANASKLYKLKK